MATKKKPAAKKPAPKPVTRAVSAAVVQGDFEEGAPETTKAVTVVQPPSSIAGYKIAKVVTVPLFLLTEGKELAFQINGPMEEMDMDALTKREKTEAGKRDKEGPMTVMPITVIDGPESGMMYKMICQSVLQSELDNSYPDQSYVGKLFAARNNGKRPKKRYFDIQVVELEKDGE
jgi:hypothetical protein